ncbi:lipoyl synthase 1 [Candidatus Hydrogenosomobacter endosymbioticus]|uniref:Lipoyl synthase n=2 Tax=Candidatus Hydrogenosomobacter endosymbioticus TaxID=2558174 RepID=A0ABM7V8Q6_9PROT|nr:lipoyl synthase 1 [Candidatus Hydrogenosomobacter endosymbioticus]
MRCGNKPEWLKVRVRADGFAKTTEAACAGIITVCAESKCPNISECWSRKHAAFMILGDTCSRRCTYCNIKKGCPSSPVDPKEPEKIANAVVGLGLRHVVITSVTRDDLPDGGASAFRDVIVCVRTLSPKTTIEILVPDFLNKPGALEIIATAEPNVFNHNIETVERLFGIVRPGASYRHSLKLLQEAKLIMPKVFTKSGLMVGLGETDEQIEETICDLRKHHVDFITIGQYLRPSQAHAPVDRYLSPAEFENIKKLSIEKGFLMVSASALTRSSYHADKDFEKLVAARSGLQISSTQKKYGSSLTA